ncbi:MAG TPA: hypothetical protein VEU11_12140 [Terriglobales bacterium]|nr:hypothetical protein [Terriglobales bacterium]
MYVIEMRMDEASMTVIRVRSGVDMLKRRHKEGQQKCQTGL